MGEEMGKAGAGTGWGRPRGRKAEKGEGSAEQGVRDLRGGVSLATEICSVSAN